MTSPPSPYIKSEYNISTTPELFASSASLDSPPSLPPLPKPLLSDFIAKPSQPESKMSLTTDSEVSSHPTLKLTGVEQLKPPGSESNYLDWSWILEIHFMATDVDYVITEDPAKAKLKPNWERDNKAVCGVISRTIHPINIRNVRHLKTDTRGLWDALKRAHQDSSAGGVMYWLRKLTMSRMATEDLSSHLDEMAKTYERLNALVTTESPLTPEDIYSASILTSLPQDWLSCVSSMMNEPRVSPIKLIDALKAEELRRKTRSDDPSLLESASATKANPNSKRKGNSAGNKPRHCTFCDMDGHDLNNCGHVARMIHSHKSTGVRLKSGYENPFAEWRRG
ncbi:uncharacterized protein PGTG_00310 [Puccinia graminis f. sp. tritici CRL 75-36-700-3]|uniref:Uncharacterized protein n=1 Tax=Puccinia graminis f. sp. tritici (strain CRL 75-36-700-3 / race SCCL) TaxID=418459 RepID=E3JRU4_PUCGT|nr:uncharacterized protein PGTG_00310 [Puccinia graminis f. sp. tritici CRL 75-36-700-3]EFP74354.2 hypothetical protein PGTG_00310 [Puccinia graminis f. sp. tritici CRL 75-36-700-3]